MGGVAGIAAFFDHAVAHSPEAGVALYSLGDPAILKAATAEIVDWLVAERLLRPAPACWISAAASAGSRPPWRRAAGPVLGLDVSAGMVAEARRRHRRCRGCGST